MSLSPTLAPDHAEAASRVDAALGVEALSAADAADLRGAWIDLAGRALEPNPFLDPDFALSAARHLTDGRAPVFVAVWRAVGEARRLVGLWPLVPGRGGFGLAAGWLHDLSTLGFPLLDRHHGADALRAILLWAPRGLPGAGGLLVRSLPVEGPTARLLAAAVADLLLDVDTLSAWSRAVLRRPSPPDRAGLGALSPKVAKELRRQRRRLGEGGALVHGSAGKGAAFAAALDRFLDLEAAGWKGAAGTALLLAPGRAAFARSALPALASRGLCRVESLDSGGIPVAMALMLGPDGAECLWKIAYAEGHARASPGVQLVLDLTDARLSHLKGGSVDSCAVPGHPMIDRVWRDRLALCDVAVSLRPGRPIVFRLALGVERTRRRLRGLAKAARARLRASACRGHS